MPKSGPIIIIEDDHDDQELLTEVFEKLNTPNIIRFFDSCLKAMDYLLTTLEKPFLIISDINVPLMSGLEFRIQINSNDSLRKKFIPFIFLTTAFHPDVIARENEICLQGYFVKPSSIGELTEMFRAIINYWKFCARPDSG
jgi:two-component SAPR family response regulator